LFFPLKKRGVNGKRKLMGKGSKWEKEVNGRRENGEGGKCYVA